MSNRRRNWFKNQGLPTTLVNTYIGGISSYLTSKTVLASRLSIPETSIENFTIYGDDVECYITEEYNVNVDGFSSTSILNNNLKHYLDIDNLCKNIGNSGFLRQPNIVRFETYGVVSIGISAFQNVTQIGNKNILSFPLCTSLGNNAFAFNDEIKILNLPNCLNYGSTVLNNDVFISAFRAEMKLYCHPSMATINSGGIEGDIASGISQGYNVVYVQNQTAPLQITDLVADTVYNNGVKLQWSEPTSTNAIQYYEIYIDGVLNKTSKNLYNYIIALNNLQTYVFTVKAVDIYYNKSIISNTITQQINGSDSVFSGFAISEYKFENNVLDTVGTNNGTATDITYASGKVGNAGVFNGSTSIVKIVGGTQNFNSVDFSVSQWFKTAQTSGFRLLQNRGQGGGGVTKGWQISNTNETNWGNTVIDNGLGDIILMDNVVSADKDNLWHQLIMTWNTSTGTCKVYIDGILKGSKTLTALINANLNALDVCIGGSNTDGQLFNGMIDEAIIWSKELSQFEITNIYNTQNLGNDLI